MSSSKHDYIPRSDAELGPWADQLWQGLLSWYEARAMGIDPIIPLYDAMNTYRDAYAQLIAAQAAAQSAKQTKDAARRQLEQLARPTVAFVQNYGNTTDAERASMGITVRVSGARASRAPATAPLALIETPARLTHQLRLVDESTPTRRARPKGVQRAELFVALTAPNQPAPSDPASYRYIASVTRGETTLSFEPDKGGMQAHYLSRWVATSGAVGPWGETVSATVAA